MIFSAQVGGAVRRVEVSAEAHGYRVRIDDRELLVDFAAVSRDAASLQVDGVCQEVWFEVDGAATRVHLREGCVRVELLEAARRAAPVGSRPDAAERVTAPMSGQVVRLLVAEGDPVEEGQGLLVIEAMKMQNELRSPRAGRVEQLLVSAGLAVERGALLAVVA